MTASVVTARRVVVTTGLVDEVPDIPGLRELWGTGAVHCPYCHGWEVRERPLAVIATGPMAAHQALLFSQWSDDVTLLLDGRPAPEGTEAARLSAVGVAVVEGRVERVEASGGVVTGVAVATDRGSVLVPCEAVVIGPRFTARSSVLESLGVEAVEFRMGEASLGTHVPSDPMGGQTSVPGVYVAGNVTEPQLQVIHAAGAGVRTAALLNMELIVEDADRALAELAVG